MNPITPGLLALVLLTAVDRSGPGPDTTPRMVVSVVVTDPDGRPVAGAPVIARVRPRVVLETGSILSALLEKPVTWSGKTDAKGRVTIPRTSIFPQGAYTHEMFRKPSPYDETVAWVGLDVIGPPDVEVRFAVEPNAFAPGILVGGSPPDVAFVLAPTARVDVTIGGGAPRGMVVVHAWEKGRPERRRTRFTADGKVTLPHVRPGAAITIQAIADANHRPGETKTVTAPPAGRTMSATLSIGAPYPVIAGRIVGPDLAPRAGATFIAFPHGADAAGPVEITTDAAGRFRLVARTSSPDARIELELWRGRMSDGLKALPPPARRRVVVVEDLPRTGTKDVGAVIVR